MHTETVDKTRLLTKYEWDAKQRYRTREAIHHVMFLWGGLLSVIPAVLIYLHHVQHAGLRDEPCFWVAELVGLVMLVKSTRFLWNDFRHGP